MPNNKKYRILYIVIALTSVLGSCKKENDNHDDSDIPIPSSETVKAFFISSVERDANGFGVRAFTVFDNNGSIRWKKMNRGYAASGYVTYAAGVIFSSEPDASASNFYAYDINTGNELWSKLGITEYFYYPIVRNDTLFCSTSIVGTFSGNIAAFNARTGALYWRKSINNPYWGVNLVLDGNTLFYIIATSSVDSKIVSFDINNKTVNWVSASFGINLASTFSNLVVSSNRVVVKSGTKLLMAFDRSTGSTAWTVPNIPFEQPLIHNNIVYSVCSQDVYYPAADSLYGIYAFDALTGTRLWKSQRYISYNGGSPFISGNSIFYSGMRSENLTTETGFLGAFNLTTGNQQWNSTTGTAYDQICTYPVAVGNRVYTFKNGTGAAGSNSRIVSYDFISGQPRDSIILTGESFGKVFIVGSTDKVYTPK